MKLIRSFMQAQMAIAAFNKIPNEMMDDFIEIVDFYCEHQPFINDLNDETHDFVQKEDLILKLTDKKIENSYQMWKGFFSSDTFWNIAWMMMNKAQYGWSVTSTKEWIEEDLALINVRADKQRNAIPSSEMTDDLKWHLYWYGLDRCINYHKPELTWHKLQTILHDTAVRGVMTLVQLDSPDEPKLIITRPMQKKIAVQDIVNKSGTMQTVSFEKDIVRSVSHMHSKAKNWSFEISATANAQYSAFGVTAGLSLTAGEGKEETDTDSDTTTTTIWEKFVFELDAPACSIVKGDISVNIEHTEQNIGQLFNIDGHNVTIPAKNDMSNTISQRYEVYHIGKIQDCIEQDSIDHCAFDNMDPSILPQGEHEWRCSSTRGKTICKAHCLSGAHYDEDWYRVYCYHTTTFWYKFDKEQTPIDCS